MVVKVADKGRWHYEFPDSVEVVCGVGCGEEDASIVYTYILWGGDGT